MKKKVVIIDTSAILSGKPITFPDTKLVTTPGVSDEFNPGGRDYRIFNFLKEVGLIIQAPSKEALHTAQKAAQTTGDDQRLSLADIEIVALALDINKEPDFEAIILSDDYSVQNVASTLGIHFQGFLQKGITKKFKWTSRCRGCGKQFINITKICPICGTATKITLVRKKKL